MNFFETTFLNLGFSWTMSKLTPYIIFTLIGLLLCWISLRNLKKKPSFRNRISLLVISSLIGFFAYFLYSPIYDGDFSNHGNKVALSNELKEIKDKELIVITIPGCPFCAESIERMKVIKNHHPALKVVYIVCSKKDENLIPYKELADGMFEVRLAKDPDYMASLSKGAFPSFLLVDGTNTTHWSNQHFGVRAVDFVTGQF